MPALAFDLGGTFLRCGVVAEDGAVRRFERMRLSQEADGWDAIVACIASFTQRYGGEAAPDEPIVLAFPGPLRSRESALCAPTIRGVEAVPDVVARLRARTGRRVWLVNDVSAAAWHLRDRLGVDRFVVVTVSSGIGCKLVDRRRPWPVFDDLPYGGEIGHVVVDDRSDAAVCDCGGVGHLGAIASGRGTERLARRLAAEAPAAFARSACARTYGATASTLTNEAHLVPAARAGDAWAWEAIRAGIAPLGRALAIVVHAAAAQRVVVIGGFAQQLGQRYANELSAALGGACSGPEFEVPVGELVVLRAADDHTCLRGAAAFGRAARAVSA